LAKIMTLNLNSQMINAYKKLTAQQRAKMRYFALLKGTKIRPEVEKFLPVNQLDEHDYYMRLVWFLIEVVGAQSYSELERARALTYKQLLLDMIDRAAKKRNRCRNNDKKELTYEELILAKARTLDAASALREHYDLQIAHDLATQALGVSQKTDSQIAQNLSETREHLHGLHSFVNEHDRSLRPLETFQRRADGGAMLRILRKRYRINLSN
jgi:hypothetical protein